MRYSRFVTATLLLSCPAQAGLVNRLMIGEINRIIAGCAAIPTIPPEVIKTSQEKSVAAMQGYWQSVRKQPDAGPADKAEKGKEIYWKIDEKPMIYSMIEEIIDPIAQNSEKFANPKKFIVAGNRKTARGIWGAYGARGILVGTYRVDFKLSKKAAQIDTMYLFEGEKPELSITGYCKEPGDFKNGFP